jgi:hypothetical protein
MVVLEVRVEKDDAKVADDCVLFCGKWSCNDEFDLKYFMCKRTVSTVKRPEFVLWVPCLCNVK